MNFTIDPYSPIPLHYQIEQFLRELIKKEEYISGKLLPTEVELAKRLGTSRNTVRQAINKLVSEGLLIRKKGFGTIVLQHQLYTKVSNWFSFTKELQSRGMKVKNYDLNCFLEIANNFAFIYFEKIKCRGGLPVGASDKLLCLISGGIDSPVAANLMQKRGAKIVFVNFDAYPATPRENQEKVKDLKINEVIKPLYKPKKKLISHKIIGVKYTKKKKLEELILPILKAKELKIVLSIIENKKNELKSSQLKKVNSIIKRY